MTTLDRFNKTRWSPVRIAIHDMEPGTSLPFDPGDYFTAKSAVYGLNEAYDHAKEWSMKSFTIDGVARYSTVRRIK